MAAHPEAVAGRLLAGPLPAEARPRSTATVTPASKRERETIRLVMVLILSSMIVQRIAIPLGGSFTSLAGPLGFAIAAYGLARGLLCFDRRRLALYLALVALCLLGATADSFMPPPFNVPISWLSGLQLLVLSSFATLCFAQPVDENRFFRAVNACFLFLAIAGLLQFTAQFAGISVFRFSDVIPPRFLTEQLTGGGYNNQIPITYGAAIFKSNGFFLAEPSIFSQFMAIALAIEILFFRRRGYIATYMLALLASVSGTGWVVFAVFLLTVTLSMGLQGLAIAAVAGIGLAVAMLAWSIALPDVFASFLSRSDEITVVGSSGHIRFVTPFWIAGTVLARAPWALVFGIGFGLSEHLWLPYEGDINTPIKIALESGLPALICYLCLICVGSQTPGQARLAPAILVLLMVTGGYAQFPPVLFPMLVILSIASLSPSAARGKP